MLLWLGRRLMYPCVMDRGIDSDEEVDLVQALACNSDS